LANSFFDIKVNLRINSSIGFLIYYGIDFKGVLSVVLLLDIFCVLNCYGENGEIDMSSFKK